MDYGTGYYTTWTYDQRGRVYQETQVINTSWTFKTQWTYNSADLMLTMKYPSNSSGGMSETVTYTYNHQMLVDKATSGLGTYVDDTWYDAAGRVTLRELGLSGGNYILGQTYSYYAWTTQGGRLQSALGGLRLDNDSLQDLRYTYDSVGNVQTISDYYAVRSLGQYQRQTFTYDAADRLASAVAENLAVDPDGGSGGGGVQSVDGTYSLQSYSYNSSTGNLASNAGVSYTYGDNNHKHAVTNTSNGNSYGYDANGNMTSRTVGGVTYTLVYDAENRLVEIKQGGTTIATYVYNGDGVRVKADVGGVITAYIGSHFEYTSSTNKKLYYYSGGVRVAVRVVTNQNNLYFLLSDHLGSTSITATSSGGFYSELRYMPWGGNRFTNGTTPTSYRYTGQREAEVGLYYYGARFYDPSLGRFVSADTVIPNPAIPLSYDRYHYVQNNPLRYVDPSSHRTCTAEEAASGDETCDQNITDESPSNQIVVPYGMVVPPDLPTHINDPLLLQAWIWLYNSPTGQQYAEFFRDNNIPIVAVSGDIGNYSNGTIYVALETGVISGIAGNMGHEAYHATEPFGSGKPSLYEEYRAYQVSHNVVNELSVYATTPQGTTFTSPLDFAGFNPWNQVSLQSWFTHNGLERYIRRLVRNEYTFYPSWPDYGNAPWR
jgi:RHS repeat-associated protein